MKQANIKWMKAPNPKRLPKFEFEPGVPVELCFLESRVVPGYDDFTVFKFHNLQDDMVYSAPLHGQLKYFPWVIDQLYRVTYLGLQKTQNKHTINAYSIEYGEGSEAEKAVLALQQAS